MRSLLHNTFKVFFNFFHATVRVVIGFMIRFAFEDELISIIFCVVTYIYIFKDRLQFNIFLIYYFLCGLLLLLYIWLSIFLIFFFLILSSNGIHIFNFSLWFIRITFNIIWNFISSSFKVWNLRRNIYLSIVFEL